MKILHLIEPVMGYFCVGFTAFVLGHYATDRAIDVGGATLIGTALAVGRAVRLFVDHSKAEKAHG